MSTDCCDTSMLLERIRRGEPIEFVYFWKHTAERQSVGKECLSQWYPAPICIEGVTYPTAEHFMMVQKARLFGDEECARRILESADPRPAKKAGRQVPGFRDAIWKARRFDIVVAGNEAKFSQHPALGEFLLGTADHVLVEASPVDAIWGIGLEESDPQARDPSAWRGLNLLGFALMVVRTGLRQRERIGREAAYGATDAHRVRKGTAP